MYHNLRENLPGTLGVAFYRLAILCFTLVPDLLSNRFPLEKGIEIA